MKDISTAFKLIVLINVVLFCWYSIVRIIVYEKYEHIIFLSLMIYGGIIISIDIANKINK